MASDSPIRIAFLHFGPPREWDGEIPDSLGVTIRAATFEKALPALTAAKPDIVVIDVNSSTGHLSETYKFTDLWKRKLKPNFRTIAWIRRAECNAVLAIWPLETLIMRTDSQLGPATHDCPPARLPGAWRHGTSEEALLRDGEEFSRVGRHAPEVMRAMQIKEPLSCAIDQSGVPTWYLNAGGPIVVNAQERRLFLSGPDAAKFGIALGVADTEADLARSLGVSSFVSVGQEANKVIDAEMRQHAEVFRKLVTAMNGYDMSVKLTREHMNAKRRTELFAEIGKARSELRVIEGILRRDAALGIALDIHPGWADEQRRIMREFESVAKVMPQPATSSNPPSSSP